MAMVNTPIGKMDSNSSAYKGYMASQTGGSGASAAGSTQTAGSAPTSTAPAPVATGATTPKSAAPTGPSGQVAAQQAEQTRAKLAAQASPGVASNGAQIYQADASGKAPAEAKAGDYVVTAGGTYKVGADGQGVLTNRGATTANYNGGYANAAPKANTPVQAQAAPSGLNDKGYGDYIVQTGDGARVIEALRNGTIPSYDSADGRRWTRGADGNIYVESDLYGRQKVVNQYVPEGEATLDRVGNVDLTGLRNTLRSVTNVGEQRANAQTDYAVNQGVRELQRAQEDALPQFQSQRNQIDIDEARARDNQALYADARGDRGGVGAAQYDAIANTAAQNRLAVQQAQTKLATDTARSIADLRAQGEFQKADAVLEMTQNYLNQLMQLEQWGIQTNLSVDEFNIGLQQWEEDFAAEVAQLTGNYKGKRTLAGQAYDNTVAATIRDQNAQIATALIEEGMLDSLTEDMLASLGFSDEQIKNGTAKQYASSVAGARKKEEARAEVANMLAAGVLVGELDAALLKQAGYTTEMVNALNRTTARDQIDTALKSGRMIYDIPEAVRKASGYTDWQLEDLGRGPAQQEVARELGMGKSVSSLSSELKKAAGYTDAELLSMVAASTKSSGNGSRRVATTEIGDVIPASVFSDYETWKNAQKKGGDISYSAFLKAYKDVPGVKGLSVGDFASGYADWVADNYVSDSGESATLMNEVMTTQGANKDGTVNYLYKVNGKWLDDDDVAAGLENGTIVADVNPSTHAITYRRAR